MKRWCACIRSLCHKRKRDGRVTPDLELALKQDKTEAKITYSVHGEANNGSLTVLPEEQTRSPIRKSSKPPTSLGKSRPKVYKVMQGTNSICHTPTLEKSPMQFLGKRKKIVIRKGEPQSALLVSDSTAKNELRKLRQGRSYSEDKGKEEQPAGT